MAENRAKKERLPDPAAVPAGILTRPMALHVPGMANVEVESGVAAGVGENAPLVDLYRPPVGGVHPIVLFVPGGPVPEPAPDPRVWGIFKSYGRAAAAQGFLGVVVSHRFRAPSDCAASSGRVAATLAWLRADGPRVGGDPGRMAIWAFSGGGALIAPLLRTPPDGLRALVLFYAGLDVRPGTLEADSSMRRWSAVAALQDAERWTTPLVIARAGLDDPALNAAMDRFAARALELNAPLDLLTHPTGRHGFDVFDHDARSRDIIARAFAIVLAAVAGGGVPAA